jgi:hypothetical protein
LLAAAALALLLSARPFFAGSAEDRHLARSTNQLRAEAENANRLLAAYIEDRTAPGEAIYVHGNGTSRAPVYFYADRAPSARHFFATLLHDRWDGPAGRETIAALEASPPAYFVDATVRTYAYPSGGGREQTPPELRALLAERYELEGRVAFADVYRLRNPGPGGAVSSGGAGTP